jgi:hypothetical protein
MRRDYNADVFLFDYNDDAVRIPSLVQLLKTRYNAVVIGVHSYNRFPANNFGVSENAFQLLKQVQSETHASTFVFGNPYLIRNFCSAKNIVACYEDDPITQDVAADLVNGTLAARENYQLRFVPNFVTDPGSACNCFLR